MEMFMNVMIAFFAQKSRKFKKTIYYHVVSLEN